MDEVLVQYNSIRINDDPWELSELRKTDFLNLEWSRNLVDRVANYDMSGSNIEPEDVIRSYLFSMDNIGTAYERRIQTVNAVLGNLGGLAGTVVAALGFVDWFFGAPFRELDLSVSFRKL